MVASELIGAGPLNDQRCGAFAAAVLRAGDGIIGAVSEIGAGNPHDDRAWRRGALPASVAVAVVGAGVSTMVAVHEQRASVAIVPVIAAIVGAWLMVSSMTRWLRGESFPVTHSVLAWVVSVPALVIFLWFDRAVGGVYIAGLATGCMVANVWAMKAARRNRPDIRR